jgi:hypothetical protein
MSTRSSSRVRRCAAAAGFACLLLGCVVATAPAAAAESSAALQALTEALARDFDLSALGAAPFAKVALAKDDAAAARVRLVEAWTARLAKERAQELKDRVIRIGERALRFELVDFAAKEGPRDLFISMHGGGGAPKG